MTQPDSPTPPQTPAPTPAQRVQQLVDLLSVDPCDDGLFVGKRQPGGRGRVFGGQVIAQGLVSAMRTVDADRAVHSLHAYFMRGGDENLPIHYRVHRDFDGGSFATRRITAMQENRPILTMTASFQRAEAGFAHQDSMPDVPGPDDLPNEIERAEAELDPATAARVTHFQRSRPVEMRWVEPRSFRTPRPA
ncbi:MAG: acyl-CoA thioesterase, partial [Sphingopyxis sp.]